MIDSSEQPQISVLLPIRNEVGFIGKLLAQIRAQTYPAERIEIIIADGMSDDGTREVVAAEAGRDRRIRLIDNPARVVAPGLNAAIREARGEVLLRIDGHTEIAADYVETCLRILHEHPEAWGVGGPIVHVGRTSMGRATAAAMSHPIGVGNASHRFADYEGYGEGAAFWTMHRRVFAEVGLFDENLIRTEDDEFNYRIAQAGGKIYISQQIRSQYFVRDTLGGLARQYFQYAFWRIPVLRKHKRPTTLRQIIPVLFYLAMVGLGGLGTYVGNMWLALALPFVYLTALLGVGLSLVPRLGLGIALRVPLAILVMHASYAWGWIVGLGAALLRPQAWNSQGTMAKLSR